METTYMQCARRSRTGGGSIYVCSFQQPRPTRNRPGHLKSYPNPFLTKGKPSRRPAVTALMLHVPPGTPNRRLAASERLGFPLVIGTDSVLYMYPLQVADTPGLSAESKKNPKGVRWRATAGRLGQRQQRASGSTIIDGSAAKSSHWKVAHHALPLLCVKTCSVDLRMHAHAQLCHWY